MRPNLKSRSSVGPDAPVAVRAWIAAVLVGISIVAMHRMAWCSTDASSPPSLGLEAACLFETPEGIPSGDFRTPDTGEIASLAPRIRKRNRVMVTGAGGERLYLDQPRVVAEGLRYRAITVREGFSYRLIDQRRGESGLVAWHDIGTIQASASGAARGALIGGLFGLVIGTAIGIHQPCQRGSFFVDSPTDCGAHAFLGATGGLFIGAVAGAILGSRSDRSRQIYP